MNILQPAWTKVDGKWVVKKAPEEMFESEKDLKIKEIVRKYQENRQREELWEMKRLRPPGVQQPVEDTRYLKDYTSYDDMVDMLLNLSVQYPDIAERYNIGHSTEGRQLWAVRINGHVKHPRMLLTPSVKFVANIHGDELVGRELVLGLARYLCENYDGDDHIRRLVDTTDIHLVPSLNPDGCEARTRNNVNDKDLNREFPGWRDVGKPHNDLLKGREKEVKAVMNWIQANSFVLSISFHDGQVLEDMMMQV